MQQAQEPDVWVAVPRHPDGNLDMLRMPFLRANNIRAWQPRVLRR